MKLQGFSRNPGAAQVTSKGSPKPLGGAGSGKASPNTKTTLPQPHKGAHNDKAVRSQQLHPGRIPQHGVSADYAGDGKTYGAAGNKVLPNPKDKPEYPGDLAD